MSAGASYVVNFSSAGHPDDGALGTFSTGQLVYPPAYTAEHISDALSSDDDTMVVEKTLSGSDYLTKNILLRFDTSNLAALVAAGLIIDSAQLYMWVVNKTNADTRSLNGSWYTWTPPATSGDYTQTAGTTALNVALADISTTAPSSVYTGGFTLANLSSINHTGFTGIRLGISGTAPVGVNKITFRRYTTNYHEAGGAAVGVPVLQYPVLTVTGHYSSAPHSYAGSYTPTIAKTASSEVITPSSASGGGGTGGGGSGPFNPILPLIGG